jgi:DNA-3-methyladenine glycosylase
VTSAPPTSAAGTDPGPTRSVTTFDRELLAKPTLEAARALLGARLMRVDADGARTGRIVEVEAYIGEEDLASHARFGRTARNEVMFGPPGIAYVYLVYGMYDCLNIVTEPAGRPAALLVRAVEPIDGIDQMRAARAARGAARRRALDPEAAAAEAIRIAQLPPEALARGPGLVAAAFSIDRSHTGLDLCDPSSTLRLEPAPPGERRVEIAAGPRVGIDYAGDPWIGRPWRLWLPESRAVSGRTPARG